MNLRLDKNNHNALNIFPSFSILYYTSILLNNHSNLNYIPYTYPIKIRNWLSGLKTLYTR